MKTYLLSFSTTIEDITLPDLEHRQRKLSHSIRQHFPSIYKVIEWKFYQIKKTKFYQQYKDIFQLHKGAGYWLWKPYIIVETLKEMQEGDVLIYCDNGLHFIASPQPLIDCCLKNNGFYFIDMGGKNTLHMFTKRRCFDLMGADYNALLGKTCLSANVQIYQKNSLTVQFTNEYLYWCCQKEVLVDDDVLGLAPLPTVPFFVKHTHDQSILSLLRYKYKIDGFRAPYQHGNHQKMPEFRVEGEELLEGRYKEEEVFYNSPYGQILLYDKGGVGIPRPKAEYLQPRKIWAYIRRKIHNYINKL
ncbi:MAG: hypothetical protein NZ551_05475 [Microscillaceae bacterium]|nr:hypothetical protein [Microscillaceae bacterium]MDW8460646.1 hypothetical protein [Cytophagales bacterium]